MRIYLQTSQGPAIIGSDNGWTERGRYAVVGPGKQAAKNWVENAIGAFGTVIGEHAAPMDLHYAAIMLEESPEPGLALERIVGDVQEYDSGVPNGATP